MTLKSALLQQLRFKYPQWISTLEVEKFAMFGIAGKCYTGNNAGRRMRELVKEGVCERRRVNGYEEYRYLQPTPKTPEQQEKESLNVLIQAML